jgi:hypothetical protein
MYQEIASEPETSSRLAGDLFFKDHALSRGWAVARLTRAGAPVYQSRRQDSPPPPILASVTR